MAKDHKDASTSDDPYRGIAKADVDAWAERERERRRAWLEGPNEDEKRAYAARLRRRRHEEADDGPEDHDLVEGRRVLDRMQVDTARAIAGAASRLAEAPYRIIGDLMRAGREWEDDVLTPPRRRRRVRYSDDD